MHPIRYLLLAVPLLLSACTSASPPPEAAATLVPATLEISTPAPTAAPDEQPAAATPTASEAAPPEPGPTATAHEYAEFPLERPILPPGRDIIDPTYRFGTTQGGEREPHNGVEFLNSQGTPVHAAADGMVVFAGDDYNGSPYSPRGWFAFYGLFVLVAHDLAGYDTPVYTLYAHLSQVDVQTGDIVRAGQPLGLVGFTGAAIGSHLHFEVRYGGTAYTDASNPEAWLQPHPGSGSLVGRIRDAQDLPVPVFLLQLTALGGSGYTQYFSTYEDAAFGLKPPFSENFAFGDLPAGSYELSFVAYKLEKHTVEIRDGELTKVDIIVGGSE